MKTLMIAATAFVLSAPMAHAAEISVMSSNAFREAYLELAPLFEKASGHKLTTRFVGSADIMKRMRAGETVDLLILQSSAVDELAQLGKVVPGSRVDLAKSGIGVAVRAGLPTPDISSGEAVKDAVLAAHSVAYSSGPSGFYLADLFQKMGIADRIKDKVKQPPSGVQVGEVVARGEADLGFQQVSELLHAEGFRYLGPLPADIQHITVFSAGLHTAAPVPAAAQMLVKFLTAPEAAPIIRKTGMEPG
jgi:molybdate transport system substrate-binding protein